MSVTEDIKARVDLVEFIGQTVKLRRSGSAYMGLCPFHAHKNNTPSFAVWPDTGTWRCFGQCNEGGDVFKFVMKRDSVDFPEALRMLAALTGVTLKPQTAPDREEIDRLDRLRAALESAATYYHNLLVRAPLAQPARDHLKKRGLTDKAIELFQLGYAPDQWEAALAFLRGNGYPLDDLRAAGLVVDKDDGRTFDRFRDRLMIPVRDEQGRLTGFQARALKAEAQPKFMNSPQTALFDKGRTLFALNLARRAIRESGTAIVVEGNLDAVAAHQAGFANVVSSQGTAITEHQVRLLKKNARRIVLALDADEAGSAATLRGLMVARTALDRERDVSFDPRGLVKIEGRLGADIRVMTLPPGLDPDDVILRDPAEWQRLEQAAEPVVAYVIRTLTAGQPVDDPKTKADLAQTVLPLIEDVASTVERSAYLQLLARTLRIDDLNALQAAAPAPARPTTRPENRPAPAPALAAPHAERRLEGYVLACLVREPTLLAEVDSALHLLGLPPLEARDLIHSDHQAVLAVVQDALAQLDDEPAAYARQHLPDVAGQPLDDWLTAQWQLAPALGLRLTPPHASKFKQDLVHLILHLRQHSEQRRNRELYFLQREAHDQANHDQTLLYAQAMQDSLKQLQKLHRALGTRGRPAPR